MTLDDLRARLVSGQATVAGVLSGTSADGIDVALTRVEPDHPGPPELLAFSIEPFEEALAQRVRAVLDGAALGLRDIALLHRDLGLAFGSAARRVAERAGIPLDLVGSHGQTVWHHDDVEPSGPASLQLGDGDFVAESAGCAVVSDFRQRDLAAGGEGAPLVGCVDAALFARAPRPLALLNLGGLANLTLIGEARGGVEPLLAFDTGPAGSLLDGLARRLLGRPFDEDGAVAATGRVHADLLAEGLAHPFFARTPPRSTGRDTFGEDYVDDFLARGQRLGLGAPDLLATAVELVAASVTEALKRFAPDLPRELVLAGGGVHHTGLVRALGRRLEYPVGTSERYGVPTDAREALAFALLAAWAILGRPASQPGATGAAPGRILGKLSPPPPRAG